MRPLHTLGALLIAAIAAAAMWRADCSTVAFAALAIGVLATAHVALGSFDSTRPFQPHSLGVGLVILIALSRVAAPNAPALGWIPLAAAHTVALGAYAVRLFTVLRRTDQQQKVDENFMRLDLWWLNAGLIACVFVAGVTVMDRGIGLPGITAALKRGLLPLSAACVLLNAVHAHRAPEIGPTPWMARLLPPALLVIGLGAIALPLARGGIAWQAIQQAEWNLQLGDKKEARRSLEAAARQNRDLRWPPFERRIADTRALLPDESE